MRLAGIREGNIIQADVRGQRFHAAVVREPHFADSIGRRAIQVASLNGRPLPARLLTARQVIGHFWKVKA
jgi:hypothetical protein